MQLEIENGQAFRSKFSQFLLFLWSKKQDIHSSIWKERDLIKDTYCYHCQLPKYYGIFRYFIKYYPSQVFAFGGMLMHTISMSLDI